ncbi:phosphoribosylaminoimidazolesuccinocarboxamide synthase [Sulfoacidibacillus thermotolerans]|uniref:Phosphoribosylaminoimidazole-succinocarboxamide synthase n=1 Tax=Sulfoacidibacillus thermotolerans TaxID=1765684 RepID=A0A2U3D8R3_SULT2|nr:phosphoribosylaminoimidazolesuccinocarboxamide synthase [Sulfoacidibacillus thermotolerans]PWI57659.1 phosphoribosylaminoimidazolesuccinocarboxamide synthase [Sulfoacidibacillus thermotolerans]
MQKGRMMYEGKAKRVYESEREDAYVVEFKDDATAFNGQKKGSIEQKGVYNNRISTNFFHWIEAEGIATHYLDTLSDREMLVKRVRIIPVEVVTRNVVAGTLATRLGMAEGTELSRPVVEFYLKNDELGDPLINRSHALALAIATREQLDLLEATALQVNAILRRRLLEKGLLLVDFKLEFGVTQAGEILVADEISPDTCRFWDAKTKEKLDKDRFRRDLGRVEEAYQEILRRIEE